MNTPMIYDIALNITDSMFSGIYNNSKKHADDHVKILARSHSHNTIPFFVGSNYVTTLKCAELSHYYNTYFYAGIHPNNATSHKDDINKVCDFINMQSYTSNTNGPFHFFTKPIQNLIAVGECGLDYYRTTATKHDQIQIFSRLLDLRKERYFLHSRHAHREMMDIICDYRFRGVVHSFDGSADDAREIIKMGHMIGINGHSLKSLKYLHEIDVNHVMVESDAPYCKMGKTYEGYQYIKTFFDEKKKYDENFVFRRRNEPIYTIQVVEVLSEVYGIGIDDLKSILEKNTADFYGFN